MRARRDSKTPANAAGGALRLALRSASAPPTVRPAPPFSHGGRYYETSIDKKLLRALARYNDKLSLTKSSLCTDFKKRHTEILEILLLTTMYIGYMILTEDVN